MANSPAEIVNRTLDAIGRPDLIIGDLEEGTEAAKPALRAYMPALRQLLRAAQWSFARKQAPLTLLADATGQTPGVGTVVQAPWCYEYALPIDCERFRFLPWNTQPVQPNPPLSTALNQPALNSIRLVPAPFLLGVDYNYPMEVGAPVSWDSQVEWWNVAGGGPTQRTVIYTNVPPTPPSLNSNLPPNFNPNPQGVYTALIVYPSQWESLFEESMVQLLASRLAMPLAKDAKIGLAIRNEASQAVKVMVREARAVNANESAFPQSVDHVPDFIRIRNSGSGNYGGGFGWGAGSYTGPGMLSYGYGSLSLGDGSVF